MGKRLGREVDLAEVKRDMGDIKHLEVMPL